MLFPAFYVCSLLSLAAAATNATDMYACCDKTFSRQTFVATKIILFRQTRLLLRQKYACRDKHVFGFVATKIFCHDKHNFVTTKFSLGKHTFVATTGVLCRDKHVVATNTCLSQQIFVATKMILAAAPVSDTVEDLHISIVVFI